MDKTSNIAIVTKNGRTQSVSFLILLLEPKSFWTDISGRKADAYTPTRPGLEKVQQLIALYWSPELSPPPFPLPSDSQSLGSGLQPRQQLN